MEVQIVLDITRITLASCFLVYASWSDYKTREVSDSTWGLLAPLAFALTFLEIYTYEASQLPLYGLCFGLTALFAIIIFYSGGFGGADAKALMCLALVLPFYPTSLPEPLSGTISPTSQILFPLAVFSNSVLLAALTAVAMLVYNIFWHVKTGKQLFGGNYGNESLGRKILILITGYRVSVRKLKEKWHVYPLEDINENSENKPTRKLLVVPKDEGRDAVVGRLEKAVFAGAIQDSVWATPGLPFLIFFTLGLLLALFLGDIVWICLRFLL
jgi:preflagellin peptidase FlaK